MEISVCIADLRNFCIRAYVKAHCHLPRVNMYVHTKREGRGGREKRKKERNRQVDQDGIVIGDSLSRGVTLHSTTSTGCPRSLSLALVAINLIFGERQTEKGRGREGERERGILLAFASSRLAS